MDVQGLRLLIGDPLFHNWRGFITRNAARVADIVALWEDLFPANVRANLNNVAINNILGGATLDALQPLTAAQIRALYVALRRQSQQFAPTTGLTNAEVLALIGRCVPAIAPADFLALASGISRPRFLLQLSAANWNDALNGNVNRGAVAYLQGALGAVTAADLCAILNQAINLTVQGAQPGDYGRICNLLALIPGTPAPIRQNVLAFLGAAGPAGGWPNFLGLANQFVRSGRRRASPGPSRFRHTGSGYGNVVHRLDLHPDAHVETLSLVAMFEPESNAQDRLESTVRVFEGRLRYFCNAHTMRHCDFENRLGGPNQAQQFDFFPEGTTEADIQQEVADLFNHHTQRLQANAAIAPRDVVGRSDINNREVGLYRANGDPWDIRLDHYLRRQDQGGVRVTRALLERIQNLFDTNAYDPSGN